MPEHTPAISTPVISKKFVSNDHESDYNNFIAGNLSVTELKTKYNLHALDVSDSDWDKIFRGSMNMTDLDTKSSSDGSLKLSDQIIKLAFYDRLSEDQKTVSFEDLIAHQNELINNPTAINATTRSAVEENIKYIRFVHKGNMLWYFKVSSRGVNYRIKDINYNDYLMNPEIPHPTNDSYGQHHLYGFSFEITGVTPFNSYHVTRRKFTPFDYYYTYKFSSPSVTYSAWFHFFWITIGANPNF